MATPKDLSRHPGFPRFLQLLSTFHFPFFWHCTTPATASPRPQGRQETRPHFRRRMATPSTRSLQAVDPGVHFCTCLTPLRPYVARARGVGCVEWCPRGHPVPQMGGRMAPGCILFEEVFRSRGSLPNIRQGAFRHRQKLQRMAPLPRRSPWNRSLVRSRKSLSFHGPDDP